MKKAITIVIISVIGFVVFRVLIVKGIKALKGKINFQSDNRRSDYGERPDAQREPDTTGRVTRYYTFTFGRKWKIKLHLNPEDARRAERMLTNMAGMPLRSYGLRGDEPNIQLRIWHIIYKKAYKSTRHTIKKLAQVFKRIKQDHNMTDVQIVYTMLRFTQFILYRRPGGRLDYYSPPRALIDLGKGGNRTPPSTSSSGWNGAGDCDTKVVLLMLLCAELGYKTVMYHSFRYSHAMIGIAVPGAEGAYKEYRGIKYYFAETTYPGWRLGQLPPQYSDVDYWTPLILSHDGQQDYGTNRREARREETTRDRDQFADQDGREDSSQRREGQHRIQPMDEDDRRLRQSDDK